MKFIDIFISLCNEKGKSPNAIMHELGFSNSTYTQWKKASNPPKEASLQKIAQYFGVTVDYLMGNTIDASTQNININGRNTNNIINSINESPNSTLNINEPSLSLQEQELVRLYRALPLEKQFELVSFMIKLKNGGND